MGISINYSISKKKNTEMCINEINALLSLNSFKNVILLVPEQFSSYYEQLIVEKSIENGSFRAEILTFKRLAFRVFAKNLVNGSKYLDQSGKSMLMYEAVSSISDKFEAFGKASKYPTFANEAIKTIQEFKRYRISPEILKDSSEKIEQLLLKQKMQEMAEVYTIYEEMIKSGGFLDADDNLMELAALINSNNYFSNTHIWFDGFDGFTPAEMDVVESLMVKTRATTFSFCCKNFDMCDMSDVFYPVVKTVEKVKKASDRLGYSINEVKINLDQPDLCGIPGEIEHLSYQYFNYPGRKYTGSNDRIKLFQADSIYEEVLRSALEISKKVRNKEMRYADISVVSGLYEEYSEYIEAVFDKFDIPVFMDEKRSIAKHPLAVYLLSILDIYISKYSYESVFSYLKSSYSNISDDEISILENYIIQWDINGLGMWVGNDWNYYTDGENNDDKLEILNNLRTKITNEMNPLFEKFKYGLVVDDFISVIYNFLISQGIFDKIKKNASEAENEGRLDYSDELKQSWNILMDIFNQLHIIVTDGKHTVEKYRIMLELALSEKKIGVIPPRTDAVFAGKLNKAYGNETKMLLILGANDPGFPAKMINEGLLTDKDRADISTIGLELAPDTKLQVLNSQINTYHLLNIPTQYLYLSYSTRGTDGATKRKSEFFSRMDDLFENITEENKSNINPDEYILNAMIGLENISCQRDRSENLEQWYKENGVPILTDVHTESIIDIEFKTILHNLLGDEIESSPTTIEKYVSCPYKYFAESALRAKPRKVYEISPPDVGSILHNILKTLVENHINDEVFEHSKYLNEAKQEFSEMKLHKIFTRDTRHKHLGERLIKRAVDSFQILKDQVEKGEFKPIELEAAFGRNKNISAPMFTTGKNSIYLNGRIDRVDGALIGENEYFRIIDYKSSDRPLKLYKINAGVDIQLASYMMAYKMHSGTNPAGMYYFTTQKKLVDADYGIKLSEINSSVIKKGKMEGYTLKNPDVIKAMDVNIDGISDVIPVKYNSDKNEFSSKVISIEDIEFMNARISEIITENTKKIFDCEFPVTPISTDKTACEYCDFKKLCGFDIRKSDCSFRQIKSILDKDVVWGKNE